MSKLNIKTVESETQPVTHDVTPPVTHDVTPPAPAFHVYTPRALADLIRDNRASGRGAGDGLKCLMRVIGIPGLSWYDSIAAAKIVDRLELATGTVKAKRDGTRLYIGE